MNELKPCPFCGGKAELISVPGYFKRGLSSVGWLVECINGCCKQIPYISDHDAVDAWNLRAKEEVIHCKDCQFFDEPLCRNSPFIKEPDDFCSGAKRKENT